jgi:hypothetical protein
LVTSSMLSSICVSQSDKHFTSAFWLYVACSTDIFSDNTVEKVSQLTVCGKFQYGTDWIDEYHVTEAQLFTVQIILKPSLRHRPPLEENYEIISKNLQPRCQAHSGS